MTWVRNAVLGLCIAACSSPDGAPVRIAVPAGASVRQVADSLDAHNLITSRRWFLLQARIRGVDRAIKPGLYEITPGTGQGELLRMLRDGDALRFRVTLPEGGTIYDLARSADTRLGVPRDAVLRAARDPELRRRHGISGPTVDGWLLPETLDFGGLVGAEEILERFLKARLDTWDPTWDTRASAAGLDRVGVLTLASIVEAETRMGDERGLVAAVYRNRFRLGMPLQADPTIQYGYLLSEGARRPRLFNTDYAFDSPWNTYLYAGLPPGPIGNPSQQSIEAVLSPAAVAFLYFVADSTGRHRFSVTYTEHLRAIREIRR